jgi:hypothetical protein
VDKVEMLVGYDMNLYSKKFEESFNKISAFMYNFFKSTIGDRVAGMNVEENVLLAWAYYFVQIANESDENGNKIMLSMLNHFDYLINSKDEVEIKGIDENKTNYLLLDESFCAIWFKASTCSMLGFLYGQENMEKAHGFLEENFYSKNERYRSMMLRTEEEA